MEEIQIQDAAADSSPATEAPAPGLDPQTPEAGNQPFHLHPRFQELIQQRSEAAERAARHEAEAQALRQQIQAFQQQSQQQQPLLERLIALQEASQQGKLPPEQEEEFKKNNELLDKLLAYHPQYKHLPKMVQAVPMLYQEIQRLQQHIIGSQRTQAEVYTSKHEAKLSELMQNGGIPPQNAAQVEYAVGGVIQGNPQMYARLLAGDTTVIEDAYKALYGHIPRKTAATQAESKQAMNRTVPRASAGTPAGAPAPPKVIPGDRNSAAAYRKWQSEQAKAIVARAG